MSVLVAAAFAATYIRDVELAPYDAAQKFPAPSAATPTRVKGLMSRKPNEVLATPSAPICATTRVL
jgi:hypothetical protein